MVKHTNTTPEGEIIEKARCGDEIAYSQLTAMYEPLICSMSERFHRTIANTELEDLRQEAQFALYRALMSYDDKQRKVTFGLYAKICIRNRMISILRKQKTALKRNAAKKASLASDKTEDIYPSRSELKELSKGLLSRLESTVFFMYLDGVSYADIAKKAGRELKAVDNALSRAKRKIRNGYIK